MNHQTRWPSCCCNDSSTFTISCAAPARATPSGTRSPRLLGDGRRRPRSRCVATYLSGELRQRRHRCGLGEACSEPPPADDVPTLTVADVHASIDRIAAIAGTGSQARAHDEGLQRLLAAATAPEQSLLPQPVTR